MRYPSVSNDLQHLYAIKLVPNALQHDFYQHRIADVDTTVPSLPCVAV